MLKSWVFLALFFSLSVHAQQNTTKVSGPGSWTSLINVGGIKSYNVLPRVREASDPVGRRLKSKMEFFLGGRSSAGWGGQIQFVEGLQVRGNPALNTFSPGDPSLTLFHPIMKSDSLIMTGAARVYLPVSDFFVSNNIWLTSYYWTVLSKLPKKFDFFNQLIPRYFSAAKYKPTDTTFYVEDWTTVTYNAAPWLRMGLGQHSQAEWHSENPTGFVADVYPFADFMLSNKVYMGPRLYLPVAVSGNVNDSARKVSLSEAQAEVYLQATL